MPVSGRPHYLGKNEACEYIEARRGLESDYLTNRLRRLLPDNSSVLELGSGPGGDAAFLGQYFNLTCSDYSPHFVAHLASKFPDTDVIPLDAQTIETAGVYDCVFSNKVLHHLSGEDLYVSLKRQKEVVRKDGLLFHSFWLGSERCESAGVCFNRYSPGEIRGIFEHNFEVVEITQYAELNADDSAYIACINK